MSEEDYLRQRRIGPMPYDVDDLTKKCNQGLFNAKNCLKVECSFYKDCLTDEQMEINERYRGKNDRKY